MSYFAEGPFSNPVYQRTANTVTQTSSTSANTFSAITGTEVTYTPTASATSVIFEASFFMQQTTDRFFQLFRIEYDTTGAGSWAEFNVRYSRNIGNSGASTQSYRDLRHFRWVLPAWSGARPLRVSVGSHASGRAANYHGLTVWDGASAGSPTTVLTDTCVMVYEI